MNNNLNLRWEEALDLNSNEYETPFIGIIQFSSEITQAVLERCITDINSDKNEVNLNLKFNLFKINLIQMTIIIKHRLVTTSNISTFIVRKKTKMEKLNMIQWSL